jgi:hypothetical protein
MNGVLIESVWMRATKRERGPGPITCYKMSRRALESQRTKGTAEEEIKPRAYFRPAAGEMNLTKQL